MTVQEAIEIIERWRRSMAKDDRWEWVNTVDPGVEMVGTGKWWAMLRQPLSGDEISVTAPTPNEVIIRIAEEVQHRMESGRR